MPAGMCVGAFIVILLVAFIYVAPGNSLDALLVVAGALVTILLAESLVAVWDSPRRKFLITWGRRLVAFSVTAGLLTVYLLPLDNLVLIGIPFAAGLIATLLLEVGIPRLQRLTLGG